MYNQSDDDELLTVKDAVKFINEENGADLISEKTANKYRCVGGGPAFEYFGSRRVFYRKGELRKWVRNRLSGPRRNTSDTGGNHD